LLHSKLEASRGYIAGPCLKKTEKEKMCSVYWSKREAVVSFQLLLDGGWREGTQTRCCMWPGLRNIRKMVMEEVDFVRLQRFHQLPT
jgi:hypothetical protein